MKKAIGILALLMVFVAGSVFAQDFPKEAINLLNADQKTKIEKLRTDFQKQQIEQRAQIRIAQLDLKEMLRSSRVPDVSKVDKEQAKISRLKGQLAANRLHFLINVRKVLTDEQWQKIRELRGKLRAERMKRRMERPRRGGRFHPPEFKREHHRMQMPVMPEK